MTADSDDFERAAGADLGPNWEQTYSGSGSGNCGVSGSGNARWVQSPKYPLTAVHDTHGVPVVVDRQSMAVQVGEGAWARHDADAITFYGRGERVGAVIRHDSVCTECGGRFLAGHVLTADLAPNMAGVARHTDCEDPKLEKVDL